MNVCFAPCPVVFDLDGTLIDSAPDIHACVNAVLRLNGTRLLTLDQVRGFVGGGVDLLWRRVISASGLPVEAHRDLVASFMTRYHDATALTRLYPNVIEALELAVGANNLFDVYPDRVYAGLVGGQNYGLNGYFLPFSSFSPFGFNGRFVYGRATVSF